MTLPQCIEHSPQGQVVGISPDAKFHGRAFLWEKGAMTDLNTLILKEILVAFGHGVLDQFLCRPRA